MAREATPLVVPDLSAFARNLGRALKAQQARSGEPLGHLYLQNLVARAAGYRNLQALKAADRRIAGVGANARLSEHARRALMQFDREGRLIRWPTKFSVQRLAMWLLWTRFEGKRIYSEREVNAERFRRPRDPSSRTRESPPPDSKERLLGVQKGFGAAGR